MAVSILESGITLMQSPRLGGAWDQVLYRLVSSLLRETEPFALEVLAGKLVLTCDRDVLVAVTGGAKVAVDGQQGAHGMTFVLFAGRHLEVTPAAHGPAYVGIAGLAAPEREPSHDVLGTPQYVLAAGEVLAVHDEVVSAEALVGRFLRGSVTGSTALLRFLPVPHLAFVPKETGPWTVVSNSRQGLLAGREGGPAMASDDSELARRLPGAVLEVSSEEIFVVGPDSKADYGYPVLGWIIDADVHLLSHLRNGGSFVLDPVNSKTAAEALDKQAKDIDRVLIDPSAVGAW